MSIEEEIKKEYEKGNDTLKNIADKYNVKYSTVRSWKSRGNWINKKKGKVATKEKKLRQITDIATKSKIKQIVADMEEDGINNQQREFVVNYIQSNDPKQSAINAKYSPHTAYVTSHRLLHDVKIKKYINEIKALQLEELHLNKMDILNRHAKIAYSNIFDFIGEDKRLKPIDEMDGTLIKDFAITIEESENEYEKKKKTSIKLKIEDRKNSLEFLTKYFKVEDESKDENINVNITIGASEVEQENE